jgi:hypothetical protein
MRNERKTLLYTYVSSTEWKAHDLHHKKLSTSFTTIIGNNRHAHRE